MPGATAGVGKNRSPADRVVDPLRRHDDLLDGSHSVVDCPATPRIRRPPTIAAVFPGAVGPIPDYPEYDDALGL